MGPKYAFILLMCLWQGELTFEEALVVLKEVRACLAKLEQDKQTKTPLNQRHVCSVCTRKFKSLAQLKVN
jgi:hypothetical protein